MDYRKISFLENSSLGTKAWPCPEGALWLPSCGEKEHVNNSDLRAGVEFCSGPFLVIKKRYAPAIFHLQHDTAVSSTPATISYSHAMDRDNKKKTRQLFWKPKLICSFLGEKKAFQTLFPWFVKMWWRKKGTDVFVSPLGVLSGIGLWH